MRVQSGVSNDAGIRWEMQPRIRLPVAFLLIDGDGTAR